MSAIDWAAELRKTLTLQELDRQVDALQAERHTLLTDAEGAAMQRQVRSYQAQIRVIEAAQAETARKQRLEELERQTLEAERERNTQRLYGGAVTSQRDIEGLQKNIEGADARIGDLETSILEAMERSDALDKQLADARQALASASGDLQSHVQAARHRVAIIDGMLPGLAARREPVARGIAPQALREYERIRVRANGVAVAAVYEGACGACGLSLSPRLLALVRRGDQLVACEHCARLLVDAPAQGAGGPVPPTGAGS